MSRVSKALVVILLIAGVGIGVYLSYNQKPKTNTPVTRPTIPAETKVKIYRLAVKDNEPILVPTEKTVKAGEDPKEAAINRLIEQGDTPELANTIPKGTRLLGLKVKDGTAVLNLSKEFRDNFNGGSEEETMLIGAILKTLGQFPDVKRVSFLLEGKPLDTLGHLDLTNAQDVNSMQP